MTIIDLQNLDIIQQHNRSNNFFIIIDHSSLSHFKYNFLLKNRRAIKKENQFGQITSNYWKQIEREKNIFSQKVDDYVEKNAKSALKKGEKANFKVIKVFCWEGCDCIQPGVFNLLLLRNPLIISINLHKFAPLVCTISLDVNIGMEINCF